MISLRMMAKQDNVAIQVLEYFLGGKRLVIVVKIRAIRISIVLAIHEIGKKMAENPKAETVYTIADVEKHNTDKDCWIVVNGKVHWHRLLEVIG